MEPSLIELFDISSRTLIDFDPVFEKKIFSYKITQILMYVFISTGLFFVFAHFISKEQEIELENTSIDETYLKNSFKEVIFSVIMVLPIIIKICLK